MDRTVNIVVKNGENDFSLLTVEVDAFDYRFFTEKYENEGCSVRGTLEDIMEELNMEEVE